MRMVVAAVTLGLIALFAGEGANANIWIDENFDDGLAFDSSSIDTFDDSPPTTPGLTFTREEGAVSSARAYNGASSYLLTAGQSLSVGASDYENPTHGAFQYIQLALGVGSIPPSGSMAKFRWNWTIDAVDYSFYVDFQSTGSAVNLVAGEDLSLGGSATIATIEDTATWKYVTLQFQKNAEPATDSRTGQTLSQGMRFYVDSPTWELAIPLPATGGAGDTARDWVLDVTAGSVFVDDLYWEGGMTNGDEASSHLRPFGEASGCEFPTDYPVDRVSSEADLVYDPLFVPQATGWLGADGASSVALSATRILWLFGDTLLGSIVGGERQLDAFINNSIAILDTSGGTPGSVQYDWDTSGGSAGSFFPPAGSGFFYWPGVGALLDGELFIFCFKVSTTGGGGFGFSIEDTTLIRVPNPEDPPSSWVQNVSDLGLGDDHQGFNSGILVEAPYVYFLGYDDPGDNALLRRMVLARASIADLKAGGLGEVFEFWVEGASEPEWSGTPGNLVSLFTPGVTETTLQYDPVLGLYFCTTYSAFAPEIFISTAPSLTGPWSEPACVYQIPEHLYNPGYISYAAKAHPELSTAPGELILTYAVNTFGDFDGLLADLNIYYPRFVHVQFAPGTAVSAWQIY